MSEGVRLISAERTRQIQAEGWTAEHDDGHDNFELAYAATAYALHSAGDGITAANLWPSEWGLSCWRPGDPVRDLVKAGALIAAEIDRRLRAGGGP